MLSSPLDKADRVENLRLPFKVSWKAESSLSLPWLSLSISARLVLLWIEEEDETSCNFLPKSEFLVAALVLSRVPGPALLKLELVFPKVGVEVEVGVPLWMNGLPGESPMKVVKRREIRASESG